jgi:allantoate deiminase
MTIEYATAVTGLLEELAVYGSEKRGGVTRLLYTPEWSAAQTFLSDRMAAIGFQPRFDRVGNLIGRLQGRKESSKTILTGSHIDTVRSGGKYDGAYGVAAALIAAGFLKETYGAPRRTIEIVSFCEEEGSRFPLAYWGSGSMTGFHTMDYASIIFDPQGVSLKDAMESSGFGGEDLQDARREDLEAFIEVHIEQGIMLDRTGDQIGVVETIAGQRRYIVNVIGETNHAGTTPMSMRRDALAASTEMMLMLEKAALKAGEPLVATVGRIKVLPNIPNVISGSVEFTLDIRHTSETLLTGFCDAVLGTIQAIADRRDVEIGINSVLQSRPAPMDPVLTGRLERLCGENGISYRRMMSGAGHDAQVFTSVCPTAMIFVPSRDGVSHSPDEYTESDDLALGVCLLAETLYELAYEEY